MSASHAICTSLIEPNFFSNALVHSAPESSVMGLDSKPPNATVIDSGLCRRRIVNDTPYAGALMQPRASIVIPTQNRPDYIADALRSIAPQAATRQAQTAATAQTAEIIVVQDGAPDEQTAAIAQTYGARYLAHETEIGVNAARNTGIENARADLICFLDDDVVVWPNWLEELLTASDRYPAYDVFGGPIRAKLTDSRLRSCGRHGLTITNLDLGPADTDAEFVWSANMAVRRKAFTRVGLFDPTLEIYGDEEEWQRRYKTNGGKTRYIAHAGVDHCRNQTDSKPHKLARAAYFRGRQSRRYDVRKACAPSLLGEAWTLIACIAHTVRFRCGHGIFLAAQSAGRVAETLRARPSSNQDHPIFLSGESGTLSRRTALIGMCRDIAADAVNQRLNLALRTTLSRRNYLATNMRDQAAANNPAGITQLYSQPTTCSRVLVLSVVRSTNLPTYKKAQRELLRSHHDVTIKPVTPQDGFGKWQNINRALGEVTPRDYDWLIILDDDVVLPRNFLDRFLFLANQFSFKIAQPAHRFRSHAAWSVTRREPGVVARQTNFVEIGPVTALHRDTFAELLPFPDLKMGWGLDNHWGALARANAWPIGVVDLTPVRHLNPVATDYRHAEAVAEAKAFLATRPYVTRSEVLTPVATHRSWVTQ